MNEEYIRELTGKIFNNEIFLSLVTEDYIKSGQAALEIGFAVLMDKPIRLLVKEGTTLPKNLIKVAEKIEYFRAEDDVQLAGKRLLEG